MDIKSAIIRVSTKKEGEDHIRLSPFAETKLGKLASVGWRKEFFIPQLGKFLTPEGFAVWLFTGNEAERRNERSRLPHMTKEEFKLARLAILLAKYHQLAAMKSLLHGAIKGMDDIFKIPWMEYKVHQSGVKEVFSDTQRVNIIKAMTKHIVEHSPKDMFITDGFDYYMVKELVMNHVKKNFGLETRCHQEESVSGDNSSVTEPASIQPEVIDESVSEKDTTDIE